MEFKTEKEVLDFLRRLLESEFWKFFEDMTKAREQTILNELNRTDIGGNARAMLNGKFLELRYALNFPINALKFYEAQNQARIEPDPKKRESMVSNIAFPDIVTH